MTLSYSPYIFLSLSHMRIFCRFNNANRFFLYQLFFALLFSVRHRRRLIFFVVVVFLFKVIYTFIFYFSSLSSFFFINKFFYEIFVFSFRSSGGNEIISNRLNAIFPSAVLFQHMEKSVFKVTFCIFPLLLFISSSSLPLFPSLFF